MRALGLDIGTRRIGVALSDETRTIASPHSTIELKPGADPLPKLIELCREQEVTTAVVGLPLSLSGGAGGRSARLATTVGERLGQAAGVEVIFIDERFSSAEANRLLIGAGQSRGQRRQTVDKIAAALILQVYLDGQAQDTTQF